MQIWVNRRGRSLRALFATTCVALSCAPANGQSINGQSVDAPPLGRVLPTAVSSLVEEGRSLETQGLWGDALTHYEESLRAHPDDQVLLRRFDVTRLHYSLEQRLSDRSFRQATGGLSTQHATALYEELLAKINSHYYATPPWDDLAKRGMRAVDIALADETYRANNNVRVSREQLHSFRRDLEQLASQTARSRHEASSLAQQVARLAARRVGLNQTATMLEFTAAAAGGLDNYSAYLTADQLRDIYSQIEGNFVGLGVELRADQGNLLIVHVIPNSPAQRAGIRADDRIVAVDDRLVRDMSTDEAASMLTGEEGSFVHVTVARDGAPEQSLTVRRERVEVPSLEDVKVVDRQHGVAYVRIPAFQKTTAADLEAALWKLHGQGMRSLILDLRGNPGGLLTASVEVADKFIAGGQIVSTRGRSSDEDFDYRAHRAGTWRVPLVVLIDGDSASASEIFAAAIKDARRGVILGERSFGKGSVQGIFPLGYSGAGIRLTTARFFSPHGHPISKVGVHPDIDARRATQVTTGLPDAPQNAHQVAYRAGDDTSAEDQTRADREVEMAVELARNQPPPVL